MSANGARLAVGMNKVELESFKETTPRYKLWLGKYFQQKIFSLHYRFCFMYNCNYN
jgi:hypothetical protein